MQQLSISHHRKSIRLKSFDYSQAGAYFITVCSWNRECLFGSASEVGIVLNRYGEIVKSEWLETGNIRHNVQLDEFIVMPNHIHGILVIDECIGRNGRGVLQYAPTRQIIRSPSQTVGAIIRGFKSASTKSINSHRDTPGYPVWQRNYYEHIIRHDGELNRIREYIKNNPIGWAEDEDNPANVGKNK